MFNEEIIQSMTDIFVDKQNKTDFLNFVNGFNDLCQKNNINIESENMLNELIKMFKINTYVFETKFTLFEKKCSFGEILLKVFDLIDINVNDLKSMKEFKVILINYSHNYIDDEKEKDLFQRVVKNISIDKIREFIYQNHPEGYIFEINNFLNGRKMNQLNPNELGKIKIILFKKVNSLFESNDKKTFESLNKINSLKFISVVPKGQNWFNVYFVNFEGEIYESIKEIHIEPEYEMQDENTLKLEMESV